ncbi:MAG: hypothetical protein JST14_10575 [Bacteroidetes bacterium]|nr:hypothetical protein [Bacteroidota bacterium]
MKYKLMVLVVTLPCGCSVQKDDPSFEAFFEKFRADSSFQISRVRFPISFIVYDDEGKKESKPVVKNDWQFVRFQANSIDSGKDYVAFQCEVIKVDSAHVNVQCLGTDNGIWATSYFTCFGGRWYMERMEDFSN